MAEERSKAGRPRSPGCGLGSHGWVGACLLNVAESPSGSTRRCLARTGQGMAQTKRAGRPGARGRGGKSRAFWDWALWAVTTSLRPKAGSGSPGKRCRELKQTRESRGDRDCKLI